jgi:hypothetical protein
MGKRTRVQIKCPHIIQNHAAGLTTEDEELGTDHRHGMVKPIDGTANTTFDRDAGPLSRFWSRINSNQLESVPTSRDPTCRG